MLGRIGIREGWSCPALAALLLGCAAAAQAADFGGFIALTSDYIYRGATQTSHDPALQADAHYYSARGWLAGLWGTSVRPDPGEATNVELDPYLGYTRALGDEWSTRLAAVYHAYLGNNPGPRYGYSELAGTLAYRLQVFLTVAVSPDTEVQTGYDSSVRRAAASGDLSWHGSLGHALSTNIGVGYYRLHRPFSSGYGYGSAGLGYEWGRMHLDLSLIGGSGAAHDFFIIVKPATGWSAPSCGSSRTVLLDATFGPNARTYSLNPQ
jgi:uncharacterized protein (TIGR02001 family)